MQSRPRFEQVEPGVRGGKRVIQNLPQAADRLWKRLYILGIEENLERLHGFRPDGYHPIHLQDELNNGQYRVIHKLGHGGYATVRLCQDQLVETPSYVAIKVHIASEVDKESRELLTAANLKRQKIDCQPFGENLCLALEHFTTQSPSGTHHCLVYPVLGPSAGSAADIFGEEENVLEILQEVSRQAVGALSALHSAGICHGDFRPSNLLLGFRDLRGLGEEEVLSLLGDPETTDVHIREDSLPTPEMPYAPRYLVYPPDPMDIEISAIQPRTQIIDFGQSFQISTPPVRNTLGIPTNYAAPEVIFDGSGGVAMDLWSLGCSLFEIRLGKRLFDIFQLDMSQARKEDYINEICSLIGPPHDSWSEYYSESEDESDMEDSPYRRSGGVRR